MSASKIQVTCLHCDQGMGTLVRIYNSAEKLQYLVMVDLGSESGTKRYATSAIDAILKALKEMESDGFTPRIELMIISHQDQDHWSLLPDLLQKILGELPATEVGEIYYGGQRWGPKPVAALKEWTKQFGCSSIPMPRAHSDYATPGTSFELASIDDVFFRVLAVNVPCSRGAADLVRNGTSAVMVAEFNDVNAILPGDATADTIGFINGFFEKWKEAGEDIPVVPCRVLSAPHHGSLRTIASNFTVKNAKLDIAKAFASYVEAENVVASAGYESKFKHPFESVMEILAINVNDDQPEHSYVVYDDATGKWKQVDDSERGIYTTIKTLQSPPQRIGWTFTITAKGEIFFEREIVELEPARRPPPRAIALPEFMLRPGAEKVPPALARLFGLP